MMRANVHRRAMMRRMDPLPRCPDHDVLHRLLAGELRGDEQASVQAHLDACDACDRAAVALVERTRREGRPVDQSTRRVGLAHAPTVRNGARSGTAERGSREALAANAQVGDFRVVELLGRGAMGEVYRARDLTLDRDVALKVISQASDVPADAVDRFLREAQAVARFNHPNIVSIYAAGRHEGMPFVALELVQGETLRERMDRNPLSTDEVIEIARGVASGLAEAHRHGVIHRDLKPANVMLGRDGRVRVLDFGLAVVVHADAVPPSRDAGALVAQATSISGTPRYMAPEQWKGDQLGGATDVWALGVMMFEMCSGEQPFVARSVDALMERVTKAEPAPLLSSVCKADPELVQLVAECLEHDLTKRPTAKAVRARLTSLGESKPMSTDRGKRAWAVGAAAVAILGGLGAVGLSRSLPETETSTTTPATSTTAQPSASTGAPLVNPENAVKQVSHGKQHACALTQAGTVKCWGNNLLHQLGAPSPEFRLTPGAAVVGVANVVQISAAGSYTCAIDTEARVFCWGELPERGKSAPVEIAELKGAIDIAAGPYHACAALQSGKVKCFGDNAEGNLGIGTLEGTSPAPAEVIGVSGAVEVATGEQHSCARHGDGRVWCWGGNLQGELGRDADGDSGDAKIVSLEAKATQLAAGGANTCVVDDESRVRCWGEGMLFRTDGGAAKPTAIGLPGLATHVTVSPWFACAATKEKKVYCWGSPEGGQLGPTDDQDRAPKEIAGAEGADVVASGPGIACAIIAGVAKCWGSAAHGRLGDGTTQSYPSPVTVPSLTDATAIAINDGYSCAIRRSGNVACWGDATSLADTWVGSARANVPRDVVTSGNAKRIFALPYNLLIVDDTGAVSSVHGGLFRGPPGHRLAADFMLRPRPELKGIEAAFGAPLHVSMMLQRGGKLAFFHLGDEQTKVVPVLGTRDVVAMDAKYKDVCVVYRSGKVACFEHELSAHQLPSRFAPRMTSVTQIDDATEVTVGAIDRCALLKGGTLTCWSSYDEPEDAPKPLAGLSDVTHVVSSSRKRVLCALSKGKVLCRSEEEHEGQLGTGTFRPRLVPKPIPGLSDVVELAAAPDHVCALRRTGEVVCWGDNTREQLGAADPAFAWSPVTVKLD